MFFTLGLLIGLVLGFTLLWILRPVPKKRHACWEHDRTVVDSENLSIYVQCDVCGNKTQFEFHLELEGKKDWAGYHDDEHRCPLCLGWKKKAWSRCGIEICELNPNGPIHFLPNGEGEYRLDG